MTVDARRPVLIGFADALAAPEAAWSLLDAGFRVVAFARDGTRPALRRCDAVRVERLCAPEHDAARAVAELRALAAACGAAALMPLDDAAVWLCDAAAAELDVPVLGPTGERAALALDKRLQVGRAACAGLDVPPTRVCATPRDVLALDALPVVLKPALAAAVHDGRLTRGRGFVCADRTELQRAAAAWGGSGPLLAQPLLAGRGEGLFGLATDGGVRRWSAHRRLRMVNPQGSGSSACVAAAVDPELAARGEALLRAAGWRGPFMLEFLRDAAGTPWFMELNGRCWGSLALARRLGLEYPAWAAADVLRGEPPPQGPVAPAGDLVCRHLGREVLHVVNVLRGPRSAAVAEWPSRWRTVRDVLRVRRGERWYNWHAGDGAVFVDDAVTTVLGALTSRRAAR